MAKLTLNTIGSRYGSIDALNDNSNLVEAAFENTLSRDGTGPNNMEADLDMDSNSIINVDEISASEVRTTNLVLNGVPVAPTGLSFYGLGKETQVATSNQTLFTLASLTYVQGINNIQVYVDGVYQNSSTYAETSTTSITFDAGLHVGAVVDFVLYYMDSLGYTVGSNATQYNPAGVGAVATNVQDKLREFVSIKDFGAVGDGVANDTAAIQAALNAFDYVYVPPGTYLTNAVIEIDNNQIFVGAGSEVSLIKNETTDGIRMKPNSVSNGNYFQIKGIGFVKTFNSASRTTAFNLENTSFIKCEDIAATNFYKGVYMARNPGSKECWYNDFHRVTTEECFYGVHIDDSISSQSVNGCMFSQMMITNWDYLWLLAGVTPSAGIRYSGYGHVFRDSYIQGCSHHVWRDQVGGTNLLEGLYLESGVIPTEVIYAPLRWFGNQDTFIRGHGDGFSLDSAFYDPQSVFVYQYAKNTPEIEGGTFTNGTELVINGSFTTNTTGWTANSSSLTSVAGGVSGNCLQLAQLSGATGYAYQTIFTQIGKRYKLSFYHKNGTFTGRLYLGTGVTGTQYGFLATLNDVNWTQYVVYFTPTTETTYVSFACAGSTQNTLYDSVTVTQVAVGSDSDISTTSIVQASNVMLTLPVYANNAAALAGGLLTGQCYRTNADPDPVYIVH